VANKYESDKDIICAGGSEMTSALKGEKFQSTPSLYLLRQYSLKRWSSLSKMPPF